MTLMIQVGAILGLKNVALGAALSFLFLRKTEVVVVNVSQRSISGRKKAVAHQFIVSSLFLCGS